MTTQIELPRYPQAPYARPVMWDVAGTPLGGLPSSQAIGYAGLDYTVTTDCLYDRRLNVVKARQGVYREDTGALLGIVAPGYQPFQNQQMFDFLDSLIQDGVATYVAGGHRASRTGGDGVSAWVVLRVDEAFRINGEEYYPYLVASNGHDGKTAFRVAPTLLRLHCFNQFPTVFGHRLAQRISHWHGMEQKLTEAHKLLRLSHTAARRTSVWLDNAQHLEAPADLRRQVQRTLYGEPADEDPQSLRLARSKFTEIWNSEDAQNGPTAYSLVNTVIGAVDHARPFRGSDERYAVSQIGRLTDGSLDLAKQRAIGVIARHYPDLGTPYEVRPEVLLGQRN